MHPISRPWNLLAAVSLLLASPVIVAADEVFDLSPEFSFEAADPAIDSPALLESFGALEQPGSPVTVMPDYYPPPVCQQPGCTIRGGCCCPRCAEPAWYLRSEALWLQRNRPGRRNLSIDDRSSGSNLENRFVLHTDHLDFDFKPGLRMTLGRRLSPNTSVEGLYFGFHNWNASARTGEHIDPFNSNLGALDPYWGQSDEYFDISEFAQATVHLVSYTSEVDNAELGLRHWLNQDASIVVGFRYMSVDERFVFFSIDDVDLNMEDVAFYSIDTDNDLFGLQVGGEVARPLPFHATRLELSAKGGLFVNFAEQGNVFYNAGPPVIDSRGKSDTRLSSVLELGAAAVLQLTPDISVRGGYAVMFVNGVALAPDQLDPSPHRANSRRFLSDNATLLLHGAFVGGEITWD